jgi:hypothetical protein
MKVSTLLVLTTPVIALTVLPNGKVSTRRSFVGSAAFLPVVLGPFVALADVADGDALPDGAAQFARIVRVNKDISVSWYFSNLMKHPRKSLTNIFGGRG